MKYAALTLENVPYAAQLGKELYEAGSFGRIGPPFSWDHTVSKLIRAATDPNYYLWFASDDDGLFVGGVIGHVDGFWCARGLLGVEDAWYVRDGTPSRAKIAMKLMQGFVSWCLDDKGAVLVTTGDIAAINSHAVDTLYRHMGFKRFGTIYKFQRGIE